MRLGSANEVLQKIENGFGLDVERDLTNYMLSRLMGYQGWNSTLQERMEELVALGRLTISNKRKEGKGQKYTLTIVKPLTGKEKREMSGKQENLVAINNKIDDSSVNEMLLKIQNGFGEDSEKIITNNGLAVIIGYQHWTPKLQSKLDTLIENGRITISNKFKNGRGEAYTLTIVKPVIGQERRNILNPRRAIREESMITNKEIDIQSQDVIEEINREDNIINIKEHEIENEQLNITFADDSEIKKETAPTDISNVDDIDILFDDLQGITRNILLKTRDIEEENRRLKMELEISKEREKRWQARAAEYKEMLYRRN